MSESNVVAEPTQAELDLVRAIELVTPMAKSGKDEDEMIVALIQNGGFAFKKAGRLLNGALESLGVRMSAKERFEKVSALLINQDTPFAPKEWSEVDQICSWLSEELDSTDEKQALAAVKRFAKEQEIELPKRARGTSGGGGSRPTAFRSVALNWMVEHPSATDEEFIAWLDSGGDVGTDPRPKSDYLFYSRIFSAARAMAEKLATA